MGRSEVASSQLPVASLELETGNWSLHLRLLPRQPFQREPRIHQPEDGDSIERIESVMCAKSIDFTSSDG